jgi:formylglycine-generating enzyme required for sulfatase activity
MRVYAWLSAAVVLAGCGADQERQEDVVLPDEAFEITAKFGIADGVAMEFIWINPGSFMLGAPSSEKGRNDDESQRMVTISRGFYLGMYEVTQEQWEAVMGAKPWYSKLPGKRSRVQDKPDYPAVYISWEDVQVFIQQLNAAAGTKIYRLPTEAEWEYACRAGTKTPWSYGNDKSHLGDYAWIKGNSLDMGEKYAHAVGMKQPNPWGGYDMHGNVSEWVQDWYDSYPYRRFKLTDPQGPSSGRYRVHRGGDFFYSAENTRSANRGGRVPSNRDFSIGARILRTGPKMTNATATPSATWGQVKQERR